jgi:hypothetical protein
MATSVGKTSSSEVKLVTTVFFSNPGPAMIIGTREDASYLTVQQLCRFV